MSQVIAITNQKGGVGKTTTTINLGTYLAKVGMRTLIVDLDPQANTTSGLGITNVNAPSIYEALVDGASAAEAIMMTPYDGLEVLPATNVLAAAEVELVSVDQREFRLRSALKNLEYDFVLIDCPPSLGLLTLNGLVASNWVLIPVQAEYYALEGLGQLLQTVQRVKKALNPKLTLLGVLMTMHNGRTSLSSQVHDEIKKHFPDKVFDAIIPRNVRLAEAPSHGKPISHYDKWSKGAKAYKELAKEVIQRVK